MNEVYQGQSVLEKEAKTFEEITEDRGGNRGKMLPVSGFLFIPSWWREGEEQQVSCCSLAWYCGKGLPGSFEVAVIQPYM